MKHPANPLVTYFPYSHPRAIQAAVLPEIERGLRHFDVTVVVAPTAFGKTAIAKTIQNAYHSSSYIVPTNQLVEQAIQEFPDTATLARLDSYFCGEWKRPCSVTRGKLQKFCPGCQCGKDLATAKYRRGPGVYNYHTYLSHKLYRDVLIVDEAHNLLPHLKERFSLTIWQHDARYPSSMWSQEQILRWVRGLKKKGKKLQLLEKALASHNPEYTVQRTRKEFNGKGTLRGQPEMRDCLQLLPVDLRSQPPVFWPKDVKKVVLLSATISRKDIEALGLAGRRVLYINCESPIDASRRPIIATPVAVPSRGNMEVATKEIADYIEHQVAPMHLGQKGLIHATYQQARILREHLTGPRYMFHEAGEDKSRQFQRFTASPPEQGKILIASGMYEGVDLSGDLGQFQVIAKIPWGNLGNSSVKYQLEKDPDSYTWNTLKDVIQASGRICRTPEDYGVTYIPDGSFGRLLEQGEKANLVPQWYLDAVNAGTQDE